MLRVLAPDAEGRMQLESPVAVQLRNSRQGGNTTAPAARYGAVRRYGDTLAIATIPL